jgi:hypothetical protein
MPQRVTGDMVGAEAAVASASTAMEQAIHASTIDDCWSSLKSCLEWMEWAQQDFQESGASESAALAGQVIWMLEGILQQPVPTGCLTLPQFQDRVLGPLQAQIAGVIVQPVVEEWQQTRTDWWRAFWAVAGLGALAIGEAVYIDWRQTHGGYGGPEGERRTNFSYRYRQ